MSAGVDDPLRAWGLAVGGSLVLAGAGILVSTWTYVEFETAVAAVRTLGALGTIAIGVGLAWLTATR